MKKLFTIVLLTVSIITWSQNWQPVNPDYTYFYKTAEDEYISNTVLVDSVGEINGQQVFFLNTSMVLCDTCENIDCYYSYMDFYSSIGSNFLQKEIHQTDGGKTIFNNENTFVIFQNAKLNQSWLFDTLQSITATITQISFDEIFPGVYDSIKNIQLSNNHLIKLTKDHGILEFPDFYYTGNDYSLQGGRSPNGTFGEEVLDYWDIFNFKIGDIFCKSKIRWSYKSNLPPVFYKNTKIEILSKETLNNNLILNRLVKTREWDDWNYFYYCTEHYDTLTIENNPSEFYNTLPGMVSKDNSRKKASLGLNPFDSTISLANVAFELFNCELYDNIFYDKIGTMTMYYARGLGKVYQSVGIQDGSYVDKIIGYVRNGDTIGEIYPDSIFLTTSINEIQTDNIHVFPVPASHTINITLPLSQNKCHVEILDMRSRLVLKKTFNQTSEMKIDISIIEKGVYLLKLQINSKTYLKKIIKT